MTGTGRFTLRKPLESPECGEAAKGCKASCHACSQEYFLGSGKHPAGDCFYPRCCKHQHVHRMAQTAGGPLSFVNEGCCAPLVLFAGSWIETDPGQVTQHLCRSLPGPDADEPQPWQQLPEQPEALGDAACPSPVEDTDSWGKGGRGIPRSNAGQQLGFCFWQVGL